MLIVEDTVGVVVSPVTEEFSVADQLKLLGWLAVNPKFNELPEQTDPIEAEVILTNGFTLSVIVTVCGMPIQLPEIVVGVTI